MSVRCCIADVLWAESKPRSRRDDGEAVLRVDNLWPETPGSIDARALVRALERHAQALGVGSVRADS